MSRGRKQLRGVRGAAFALSATPSAAFDSLTQQSPGVMFYFSIPFEAVKAKGEAFSAGLAFQGKRDYETVRIDSRLLNTFHRQRHRGEMDHRRRGGGGRRGRGRDQGQVHRQRPAAGARPAGGAAAGAAERRWERWQRRRRHLLAQARRPAPTRFGEPRASARLRRVAFDPHVPEIAGVIQLAIAPVFMLTAVGTVIGALNIRLGRAVDRRRELEERLSRPAAGPSCPRRTRSSPRLRGASASSTFPSFSP